MARRAKASSDPANDETEKALAQLERKIASVYQEAAKDIQQTVDAFFDDFKRRDEEMLQQVKDEKITMEQYQQWRLTQLARGSRYEAMRDTVAERVTKANEVAVSYTNDATPGVYSINRNYSNYQIEQSAGNVGFTLFDEKTVRRLLVEDPAVMPYYPPERAVQRGIDLEYGQAQITRSVTSSILQGRSVSQIADDLQQRILTMSRASAIRTARTAITSAQNGGRQDSYQAAAGMGIQLKRKWVATLDGRTRHSHRRMDGEVVGINESFSNGCRYPGDPRGKPAEVYNCRCRTITVDVRVREAEPRQRRGRDLNTGRNVLVSDMSYKEWEEWVKQRGG